MELFLQRTFDALFNGAIYASVAVALVAIYRATGLLNFAQGEVATFSAYVGFLFLSPSGAALTGAGLVGLVPGIPWTVPLAIAAAVTFGMMAGALTERLLIRSLEGRSDLAVLNVSIGLMIAVNGLTVELWGTSARRFPSPFPSEAADYFSIGGARLRYESIGVWITLLIVLAVLGAFLHRTKIGLAFRAITADRVSAELSGIRVERALMVGWAVAAGLGALSAALVAESVLLEPFMMIRLLIFAFAAATIGGLDSPLGAIVGGVVVAMAQTLVPGYVPFISTELSLLPPLLVMAGVLLVRPSGLFGSRPVERV